MIPADPTLPPIFMAYASERRIADSMTRLANDLARHSARVATWQEPSEPGFIWTNVRRDIDAAEVILAETTQGNANVLFELGYAIARRKKTFQLINSNEATPIELPPLEPVAQIHYDHRSDVVSYLTAVQFSGRTLFDDLAIGSVDQSRNGLYYLPARRAGDLADTLQEICDSGVFRVTPVDVWDTDYLNLGAQARAIAQSPVFVGLLVSENTRQHWTSNATTMLYAGIAAGLGRRYVLLAQEPLRRFLDLQENLIPFHSETEAENQLRRWILEAGRSELSSPTVSHSTVTRSSPTRVGEHPAEYVFLGSTDAGLDLDLPDYFIQTPQYLQARRGQQHIFVGAKGSGKTALFRILFDEWDRRQQVTVPVSPADFEFPRLAAVFDEHLAHAHWEFVFGSFWRFVIVTEILRAIRHGFLDYLIREGSVTPANHPSRPAGTTDTFRTALIDWLADNDRMLSLDFASRVQALCERIAQTTGTDAERRAAYEELLQTARMYDVERHLADFCREYPIQLLIDDLDRNWNPVNPSASRLIVSLLNVLHDLMRGPRPIAGGAVFIRTDVHKWMQRNDPEIARRDSSPLTWSDEGLHQVVAGRIQSNVGGAQLLPDEAWNLVFPETVQGERTCDFVVSRTHRRPRHVILFCRRALELARFANRDVSEADFIDAWGWTGEQIIYQIGIEFRNTYPELQDLIFALTERPMSMRWSELEGPLRERLSALHDPSAWAAESIVNADLVLEALYESGVLGVETRGGAQWFEYQRSLDEARGGLDADFRVVVHPAFRQTLRSRR